MHRSNGSPIRLLQSFVGSSHWFQARGQDKVMKLSGAPIMFFTEKLGRLSKIATSFTNSFCSLFNWLPLFTELCVLPCRCTFFQSLDFCKCYFKATRQLLQLPSALVLRILPQHRNDDRLAKQGCLSRLRQRRRICGQVLSIEGNCWLSPFLGTALKRKEIGLLKA